MVGRRRARTFSVYLASWLALFALAPVLLPTTLAIDSIRFAIGNRSLTATRLLAMAVAYLTAEVVGVSVAGMQWLASGFGRRTRQLERWSYWLQGQWTSFMMAAVLRIFSMSLRVNGLESTRPGPYILMMRHASMVDVLLPATLIAHRQGLRLRWILKNELLMDPALDVVGRRLPNHFVDRTGTDTAAEVAAIRQLAEDLGPDDAVMIYPEGTRFSPVKRDRLVDRMTRAFPEHEARLAALTHVLPPQPAGSLALLEGGYDVVFATHAGLEGLASLRNIWTRGLTGTDIAIEFWRARGEHIPQEEGERLAWLLDRWGELDRRTAILEKAEPGR